MSYKRHLRLFVDLEQTAGAEAQSTTRPPPPAGTQDELPGGRIDGQIVLGQYIRNIRMKSFCWRRQPVWLRNTGRMHVRKVEIERPVHIVFELIPWAHTKFVERIRAYA
jgi:hypothetical protein